jgi:hypothetical protein
VNSQKYDATGNPTGTGAICEPRSFCSPQKNQSEKIDKAVFAAAVQWLNGISKLHALAAKNVL